MRRADREVVDKNEIKTILDSCKVCRIAMIDKNNEPYIIPVNFGYVFENDNILTLYIHGANEGRKIDIINKNSSVCIEMDCNHKLTVGETICSYGYNFSSIVANGTAEILTDINDKIYGLKVLTKTQTNSLVDFTPQMVSSVNVIKITVADYSCKKRNAVSFKRPDKDI